jgi:hypothetical protein
VVGRDPATRCGQLVHVTEERCHRLVAQVREEPFRKPRRRLRRIEARLPNRRRPVRAQVGRHRPPVTVRHRTLPGEHRVLEREHHRRVDLIHRRPRHPAEPECAGIEPGSEDHRLLQAGSGRGCEEVVKEPRPHRHVVPHAEPGKIRISGGLFRGDGYPPGELIGGGLDERRTIRVTNQRFGVMSLHGTHSRSTQGSDADPANDVPASRLRGHNAHHATKSFIRPGLCPQ